MRTIMQGLFGFDLVGTIVHAPHTDAGHGVISRSLSPKTFCSPHTGAGGAIHTTAVEAPDSGGGGGAITSATLAMKTGSDPDDPTTSGQLATRHGTGGTSTTQVEREDIGFA